jgi:hypothetical protein
MRPSGRSAMRTPRRSDSRLPRTSAIDVPRSAGGSMKAATIRRRFAANCGLFATFLRRTPADLRNPERPSRGEGGARRRCRPPLGGALVGALERSCSAVARAGLRRLNQTSAPVRPKSRTPRMRGAEAARASLDRARRGRRATVNERSLSPKRRAEREQTTVGAPPKRSPRKWVATAPKWSTRG